MTKLLVGYVGRNEITPVSKGLVKKDVMMRSVLAACGVLGVGIVLQQVKPVHAAVTITTSLYSENFDGDLGTTNLTGTNSPFLSTAGTQAAIPGTSGWDGAKIAGTGTGTSNMPYTVTDGSQNSGAIYSMGNDTNSAERSLGMLASGTNTPAVGVQLINNTGATINAVTISFTAEFWRTSTSVVNTDVFGYFVGSASSTNYLSTSTGVNSNTGLDIVEPSADVVGTNGSINGNLVANQAIRTATLSALNWQVGQALYLRWQDHDDTGSDAMMGIDGFTLNVVALPTWTGGGTDSAWSDPANWNTLPVNGNAVIFTGTTQTVNTNDSLTTVDSITFDSQAGNFTLNGNALTINGGITNSGTSSQVVNIALTLGAAQSISSAAGNLSITQSITQGNKSLTVGGGGNVTLNGISGAVASTFSKTGTGTLTLTGSVSLGGMNLSAGTVVFNTDVTSNEGNGAVAFTWGNVTLQGTGSLNLTVDQLGGLSQAQLILGNGTNGTGYSGTVNIHGVGQINVRSTTNPLGTGTINVLDSGLQLITSGGSQAANNIGTIGNIVLNGADNTFTLFAGTTNSGSTSSQANTLTLGPVSGTGRVVFQVCGPNNTIGTGDTSQPSVAGGTGAIQLQGSSTYTGDTYINMGTTSAFRILNDNALPTTTNLKFGMYQVDDTAQPGFGANLDLNGHNLQVASIQAGIGATANAFGSITNTSTQAGTLTVSGGTSTNFILPLTGNLGLTKSGASTLTLLGANAYTGNTAVNAGSTVTFGSGTASATSTIGTVTGAGSLVVAAQATVTSKSVQSSSLTVNGALTVASGSTGGKVSTLTIGGASSTAGGWTGKIDLNDNAIAVATTGAGDKATKLATLADQITTGRSGGTWTGNGITSSVAAAKPTGFGAKAVGLFDNGALNTPLTTLGAGGPSVSTSDIIVGTTFNGDANFDGKVDINDLTVIANHWQSNQTNWATGDIDLSGFVDINDLTAVANNWQAGAGPGFSGLSFASAMSEFAVFNGVSVPEPASLGVLAMGGLLLMRRRR